MMKLDLQYTGQEQALDSLREETLKAFDVLQNKSGKGNDFLGWIDLPVNYDREEFQRILEAAKRIREDSEALVVIGIGGSYLGARAVVDALTPAYGTKNRKFFLQAIRSAVRKRQSFWNILRIRNFRLTSFQNQVRRQSLRSHFAFSVIFW